MSLMPGQSIFLYQYSDAAIIGIEFLVARTDIFEADLRVGNVYDEDA